MATILDQILADTRALVAERKALTPPAALERRSAFRAGLGVSEGLSDGRDIPFPVLWGR